MKRRRFCQYLAISSACYSGAHIHSANAIESNRTTHQKKRQKWVVLYWMPYDNDLSHFGEPIIQMLRKASTSPDISVVVQSDQWGDRTMRRRQISVEEIYEIALSEEDSSNASNLSAYLDWAYQTFEADRWAIIIVGHGGKIDEISPDDHQGIDGKRTWMKVDRFANAVSRFNRKTDDRVELLFLQNCTKSTLEVVYETRNCARYILASQYILGAPNYYYNGFLQHLQDSELGGKEAAIAIIDSEQPDMYGTLTLIDSRAVELIPDRLSKLLDIALEGSQCAIDLAKVVTYRYAEERHCDFFSLLTVILEHCNYSEKRLIEFADFLNRSVILVHRTDGEMHTLNVNQLCGIGLYLPESEQDISRYSSFSLSQRVDLDRLYRRII